MTNPQQPFPEDLLAENAALREEVSRLENEKADMELLLQMTAEHSDSVADELYSTVEETQRESEERFEAITNTVPIPIIVSHKDKDVIVYANAAAGELTGVDKVALPERSIVDFYRHPEERQKILAHVQENGYANNWEIEGQQEHGEPFWAAVFIRPFIFNAQPCLLEAYQSLTVYKQAEQERVKLQAEIIEAQQQAIEELSTPVIPIMDRIIVMPMVGNIDSMRARDITRSLLEGIGQHRAKIVILDVTGVRLMDTGIVNHLNKTIQAARLKGARTIVTGISDAVAESIVDLGIDWGAVTTLSDLQTGLLVALKTLGVTLKK